MPVVTTPLPEVDQLIARPVVYAVLEQIKKITNIPQDTDITFIGQGGTRHQFSNPGNPQGAPVKLASDAMLIVEVDEEPDEGLFATTVGNRPEQQPDFADKVLGVECKPSYAGFDYVVSVVYRTPSRSEAIRWRNDARFKASQMRMVNLHEIEYQYQIPRAAIALLQHVHSLREKVAGYGQDFAEYMTQHFTTRATVVSTVVGTQPEYMIREKQYRVQGTFDFSYNPAKQEKTDGGAWEVRFTYTFSFHKPTEYSMRYPIVVHNQPIDTRFIPLDPQDPTEVEGRMSLSLNAMHFMEEPIALKRITGYEKIWYAPTFDGWTPDVQPPAQRIIASFLLGLQQDQQGVILNLNQLGDYFIDSDVMKWIMAEEWRFIQLPHTSALQIHLYRNECLSASQAIRVNEKGELLLLEKADARKRYRIVISVAKKLHLCDARSIKRLSRYPEAMCKIIKATRATTGEIYEMAQYVDISKFASCAIKAGVTQEQAYDHIITMKTSMNMAVLADRVDGGSLLSPGAQLKALHPNL